VPEEKYREPPAFGISLSQVARSALNLNGAMRIKKREVFTGKDGAA